MVVLKLIGRLQFLRSILGDIVEDQFSFGFGCGCMTGRYTVHEEIVVDVIASSAFVILTDKHSWEVTHLYRYIL